MTRLTPRGRQVAWLVLGAFLSAWMTGEPVLIFIGAAGVCLLAVTAGYSLLMVTGVAGKRVFSSPTHVGDACVVTHRLRNISRVRKVRVQILDAFWQRPSRSPSPVVIGVDALRPGQEVRVEHTITCFKRGEYQMPPAVIRAMDPFGLWRSQRAVSKRSDPLLVYPPLYPLERFPMLASGTNMWLGLETSRVSGDHQEFFGIREYRPGDSPRRIHWPSTARQRKLITKEFERGVSSDVTLLLDLYRRHNIGHGAHSTLEYSVTIAAAVSRHLLDRGEGVQLIGHGRRPLHVPMSRGKTHWYTILEHLATVDADGDVHLADALYEMELAIPQKSAVIAFLHDRAEQNAATLANLCADGIQLHVFLFRAATFLANAPKSRWAGRYARAQAVLENVGASIYPVEAHMPISEMFSQQFVER